MKRTALLVLLAAVTAPWLPAQTPPPAPSTGTFNEAMLKGKEFLLERQSLQKGIFPSDFSLGPLQGYKFENQDEGKALGLMNEFLTGVLAGRVPEDRIGLKWKTLLTKILNEGFALKHQLKTWRLGKLRWDSGGSLYAAVALYSDKGGVARGQIYAEKSGQGIWEISDLQLDFSELGLSPVKRTEPFSPATYEHLLGL